MADAGTLGELMRTRRAQLGLTQDELAERIGDGVRQTDVSRLERGKVTLPRRRRLERIAAALELPLGELLARSGWGGAERAVVPLTSEAVEEPEPEPAPAPPPLPTPRTFVPVVPPVPVQSSRLQDALERSRALRARTADLMGTLEATWGSPHGADRLTPPRESDLDPGSGTS